MSSFTVGDTVSIQHSSKGRWIMGKVYLVVRHENGIASVADERGNFYPADGGSETFAHYVNTGTCGNVFEDQRRFMHSMGQMVHGFKGEQVALYLRLTCEELCETMCAASPSGTERIKELFSELETLCRVDDDYNEVELFDGLEDVLVTTIGAGISAGYPMTEGWNEVLKTNLAKIDPITGKVRRRADGKIMKPDGWVGPTERLRALLAASKS